MILMFMGRIVEAHEALERAVKTQTKRPRKTQGQVQGNTH
jgi:hypothetical protein